MMLALCITGVYPKTLYPGIEQSNLITFAAE